MKNGYRQKTKVEYAALHRAVVHKMVAVPIEKLGLDRSVPEFCKARGWPEDGAKGYAFVGAALSCYAVGAIHQRLRVPVPFWAHPTWKALVDQFGSTPTVSEIVESLSPSTLDVGNSKRLDSLLGIEAKREVMA